MTMKKNLLLRAGLAGASALAAVAATMTPASAATSYESDTCTSSGNAYCFAAYFSSRGTQTWYSTSACHVVNRDIPDWYGYSPNGAILVRYIFRARMITGRYNTCIETGGDGQGAKNNMASGSNGECSATYRVYYSSGHNGLSQAFLPTCGDYWPAENLVDVLKNENASLDRY
ncbi:hypothetical protein AQF52_3473 [Streptomyces venezuelae]|uniref:hypothetical protein n=1 Tax=Streptomyces gardneri TaxID=66892 RepID=UPI0006BCE9E3|nr:hypothetical protein [Streptomyces gardneri]ALO09067.1 hypothetical protein AQF52_3473 [Streptomyces venezuelae]QPK46212.1 hypothetical protein H4W23_17290 [Streptomyces gardneri]WRK37583.1 hypothetical protein U0M97_17375 [Streptomyces venezuelae]CUM40536.1 hypothetical protein BN2537_10037 [Streptomyces venezuelae]